MKRTEAPKKQPVPFAIGGLREELLPSTPAGGNTASYINGFPPITMVQKNAGGLPPKGQDMNQILYELSNLSRWASSGAINSFDSSFSTGVAGYPKGAQILGDDGYTIYISKIDDNTSNPSTGGAGWFNQTNAYLMVSNNLSDLSDMAKAKENLELDKVGNYAALPLTGGDLTGIVKTSAEIQSTSQDNFRMVNGEYGTFCRQDGNNFYLMQTAAGDQYGGYSDARPMRVDLETGIVYINNAQPYSANNCPFPVGYFMLMGSASDPNVLYPGTTWQDMNATGYDGRVLSLGYDALGTGGSNQVTINADNLPDHSHKGGWGAPGAAYANDLRTGTDNTGKYDRSMTNETFTDASGSNHVTNSPLNVTNAYVHVLGWMRTA